jgi:hypothetical protein
MIQQQKRVEMAQPRRTDGAMHGYAGALGNRERVNQLLYRTRRHYGDPPEFQDNALSNHERRQRPNRR